MRQVHLLLLFQHQHHIILNRQLLHHLLHLAQVIQEVYQYYLLILVQLHELPVALSLHLSQGLALRLLVGQGFNQRAALALSVSLQRDL